MKKLSLLTYLFLTIYGSTLISSTCGDKYLYLKDTSDHTLFIGKEKTHDETLVWMVRATGFNPSLVIRKEIVSKGKYKFSIPINESGSEIIELIYSLRVLEGKKRVAILTKAEGYKDGRAIEGESDNLSLIWLKEVISRLKNEDIDTKTIRVSSKTEKNSFHFPLEINDKAISEYTTFMERYLYSTNRNINTVSGREQERLAKILTIEDFKKLYSSIKRNNILNYIYDRSKKQIGSWPIALSTGVIVVVYQNKKTELKRKQGHVLELLDINGKKHEIEIDQVGSEINFSYQGKFNHNQDQSVTLYDTNNVPYVFQIVFESPMLTKLHLLECN